MEALKLMKTSKSVDERANDYVESIKRDLKVDLIDRLLKQKDRIVDELRDLKDFVLDTNLNSGVRRMTKEECQKRFADIIEKEYQLSLLEAELKIKTTYMFTNT